MAICDVTKRGIWGCCLGSKKCQKNMRRGCGGVREIFVGEMSVARQPRRLENGLREVEEVMLGPDLGRLTFQFYFCVD